MKLESTTTERMEQLEKSLEVQIRDALIKQHELEERLQPSGSASERYRTAAATAFSFAAQDDIEAELMPRGSSLEVLSPAMQDALVHVVEASMQEMRNELVTLREQREVEADLLRKELRAEQSFALQEQAELIEATKVGLSVDLKQGFDRLRSDLGMADAQQGSVSTVERVERLEAHCLNTGRRVDANIESTETQLVEMQRRGAQIDYSLGELHTRLEAAERAAFEMEEPASLVKRLALLEASGQPSASTMALSEMHPLLTQLDKRLEQLEATISQNAERGDVATFQVPSRPDVSSLKAVVDKAQRDVQKLATELAEEREERRVALADVDNMTCVVAKAAASTIERMENRFVERMNELTGDTTGDSHAMKLKSLNSCAPGEAPTVTPSPIGSPLQFDRSLQILEEKTIDEFGRLANLMQLQTQRIEAIDGSAKESILRLSEKYQAACELGTRTLLLEKAVKWLLEVGMRTERQPKQVLQRMRSDPSLPGANVPQSPGQISRMLSSVPVALPSGVPLNQPVKHMNQVFRSQSQPASPHADLSWARQAQGLVKFVHRTLGDAVGTVDPAAVAQLLRNDAAEAGAASNVAPHAGQPIRWTARSASPQPPALQASAVDPQPQQPRLRPSMSPSTRQHLQPRQQLSARPASPTGWRLADLSRAASGGRGTSKSADPPVERQVASRSPSLTNVLSPSREKHQQMASSSKPSLSATATPRGAFHWVTQKNGGNAQQDVGSSTSAFRGRPVARPVGSPATPRQPVKQSARLGTTR
jgi:hypothetical protein